MIPDRYILKKLKRRVAFLLVIVFFLLYWIRLLKYDLEYYQSENNILNYEMIKMESQMLKLRRDISSLKTPKEKEKKIKIINTKKVEIKKDSLELKSTPIETTQPIVSDTLN
jgi:predicted Holliday junction resolvase-like endonuclease